MIPRISDLPSILPSSCGKIELETVEEGKESQIIEELIKKAVKKVFNRHFQLEEFTDLLQHCVDGSSLEVSDTMPTAVYHQKIRAMVGLSLTEIKRLNGSDSPATVASALGVHPPKASIQQEVNKKVVAGEISYWG